MKPMSRYRHGHRSSLQKSGIARRLDAEKLFEAGRYAGAVYMAGYKVECALKVALMEVANVDHLRELEGWLRETCKVDPDKMLHNLEVLSLQHPGVVRAIANPGDKRTLEILRARADCNRWSSTLRYDASPLDDTSARRRLDSVDRYSRFIQTSL
jgi:hypothetical protein